MSSKQRVRMAFAHEQPDRVPIDYSANSEVTEGLMKHFGLKDKDHVGLMNALGVDFRHVGPAYTGKKLHADPPGMKADNWGKRCRWVSHGTGGYWDYCDWPLKDATMEQVEAWPMPSPDDHDYSKIADRCLELEEYAICVGGAGDPDIINSTGTVRTMEQVLVDLATDDPVGLRLIDRKNDIKLEILRRTLDAGRGRIDVLCLGEDLGTQIGPIMSLDMFRKHIRPRMQPFVDLAKMWKIPAMIHSCGSSSWAFDEMADMGIAVIDTLQPEAKDMAPAYLKKRYGAKLAFHGMISTAGPVAYGTVDDVVKNVKDTLRVMMPGGGYAMAPTHQLQSNSPTENVVAMYETARKLGQYR